MKTRNTLYFTTGCLLLAYDYAWTGYIAASIFMGIIAMILSYLVLNPSNEELMQQSIESIVILLVIMGLLFILDIPNEFYFSPILLISAIATVQFWSATYNKVGKRIKHIMEKFTIKLLLFVLGGYILCLVLFTKNPEIQYEVFICLFALILPIISVLSIGYIKRKVCSYRILQNKIKLQ